LRRRREEAGEDRWDEVWDGVYVMGALPNDEHQGIVGWLTTILTLTVELNGLGVVRPGVNVSDRPEHWKENYRCPDVVVYLKDNPAENRGTHWFGGPDLAAEVVCPGEDPHAKLDFYAKVGTRELLVVDRDPWRLELFRLTNDELKRVGLSEVSDGRPGEVLASEVVPFTWRLVPGDGRPRIEATYIETGQTWHA
ncbi:MAG TPA: Uma2 family endonuclease, partial [Planctomycetaceae bacterium]